MRMLSTIPPWLRRVVVGVLGAVMLTVALSSPASAHPMPSSVIALDVHSDSVGIELQLPVDDLSIASGIELRGNDADATLASKTAAIRSYLEEHLQTTTTDGQPWTASVNGEIELTDAQQTSTGSYREIVAHGTLTPPAGASLRQFTFRADPIVHQVVTHSILVTVRSDWAGGQVAKDSDPVQIGVIGEDTRTMTLEPLSVDLDNGSTWRGFVAMVSLGIDHIMAGTDHLLFLLVLLLPAPLIAAGGRWRRTVGARKSALRIAAITLAFTLGHSTALAVSTLGHVEIPSSPIEVAIALTILIGAVHALRPLFPGREALVAGVFGLIHGMAFSFTLAELGLSTFQLAISLFGFNLGIEIMQLTVVAVTLPSIIALSRTSWYTPVRIVAASAATIAAAAWMIDRLGHPNPVATHIDQSGDMVVYVIAGLAILAATSWLWRRVHPATPDRTPVDDSDRELAAIDAE